MDIFGIRKLIKFDTTTTAGSPFLKYASFTSDTSTGKETNKEILSADAIANEAINRELGFQDTIMKNSMYANKSNPREIISVFLGNKDLKKNVTDLFKDIYIKCLNRGYTQSQSKKIAKAEAQKYINEEANYMIKKFSI